MKTALDLAYDFGKARDNLRLFYDPVEMPGGYVFDHPGAIRQIDSYYNSQFTSGPVDDAGFQKFFYNIVKSPCDVAAKFVDLDTKDVILVAESPDDEWRTWFMQRDLRQWLKSSGIASLLNQIGGDFPKYGTVVTKRMPKNGWKKVNIQNLRMDPSAPTNEDSSFFYEVVPMTARQIAGMKAWDQDEVNRLLVTDEPNFLVYECYDYNPDVSGMPWVRSFRADFLRLKGSQRRSPESQINVKSEYRPGIVLFAEEVDELPHRKLDWESVPGRWLGMGLVEYMFDNQIRMNELANLKGKGLYFSSLHIYKTNDEIIQRNLLTDVQNGDIIKGDLAPVDVAERDLAAFNQEEQRWDKNSADKTFSFDIARGGDLPSQTPLGVARLQAGMVASYFELKRENFGIFVKDVILKDVIPEFQKEQTPEHVIKFLGSDEEIQKLHDAATEAQVRSGVIDYIMKHGIVPTPEMVAQSRAFYEQEVKKKGDFFVNIPKAFYRGAEFAIDIVITGEQVDVASRLQSITTAMTMVATNPAILQDPALRTMFYKMLELVGVNPTDLNLMKSAAASAPPMAAGAPGAASAADQTLVAALQRGGDARAIPGLTAPAAPVNVRAPSPTSV